jgi:hypothetical protein
MQRSCAERVCSRRGDVRFHRLSRQLHSGSYCNIDYILAQESVQMAALCCQPSQPRSQGWPGRLTQRCPMADRLLGAEQGQGVDGGYTRPTARCVREEPVAPERSTMDGRREHDAGGTGNPAQLLRSDALRSPDSAQKRLLRRRQPVHRVPVGQSVSILLKRPITDSARTGRSGPV